MNSNILLRRKVDKAHIKLSYITHFYCDQSDINSVVSLLREYEQYDPALLDMIQFIIVDDGSPVSYDIPDFNLNITWLKINEDIKWNQAGARNLGVLYAQSDKFVVTDLDHIIHENTLRYMVERRNPGRSFFKIYRNSPENPGKIYKGHSNLFFMSRARFMRFFGYDEEFAGNYGAEDYRFVKYQKYQGSVQRYLPKKYLCSERNLDREKSYHTLQRDLSANTPVDARKKQEIETYGKDYGHSRMFLNFTWQIIDVHNRPAPVPPENRWWKPLWWLRYAFGFLAR
ncbi:glycosyltransferase family A protein [Dickeya lacustris]|uniref:Glycosyltransferase family A protein n=1 Tax=Dickeya lacustris TaxID=2259638 RepID=A0ABY8G2I5_9GAMM|nr:glycosyltransferase family A protein [Dickeya lacustris]WFN54156.1 glycosyltransferase family A protein [Dickeya lacustris]